MRSLAARYMKASSARSPIRLVPRCPAGILALRVFKGPHSDRVAPDRFFGLASPQAEPALRNIAKRVPNGSGVEAFSSMEFGVEKKKGAEGIRAFFSKNSKLEGKLCHVLQVYCAH